MDTFKFEVKTSKSLGPGGHVLAIKAGAPDCSGGLQSTDAIAIVE